MLPGRTVSLQLVATVLVTTSATPLRAAEEDGDHDPSVTTTVGAPAPRAPRTTDARGLDHRRLPLESRTSLVDYVARNVPGATWGADGGLRLRGGDARDTAVFADGFRLRRSALPIGVFGQASVLTAGYGADLGDVPGGAIVAELRSGTSTLEAEVDVFRELGDPAGTAVAATVAGPLVRDRLFFLLGLMGTDSRAGELTDPLGLTGPQPGPTFRDMAGALKVTWVPSRAHRLDSLTLVDGGRLENGDGLGAAPEAQLARSDGGLFTSLRWTGDFGSIRARSQVGFDLGRGELRPQLCRDQPVACEEVPPIVQRSPTTRVFMNGRLREDRRERGWELVNGVEVRLATGSPVEERLRLTSRVSVHSFTWSRSTPANKVITLQGPIPEAETELYANDPRLTPAEYGPARFEGSALHTFHALDDEIRVVDRLWLIPGVGLAASRSATATGHVFRDAATTQHLGLAWDVAGDRRTWLRASSHRRVQPELESAARFALGTPVERRCSWNPATGAYASGCSFSGGSPARSIGLPCGPDGLSDGGGPCREAIDLPRTWEHTLGARRALSSDLALNLDLVYRQTTGLPETRETNRVGTGSLGDVVRRGTFKNGRAATVTDWSTPAASRRRYLAATASLSKQAGALRAFAAYTWSRSKATLPPDLAAVVVGGDGSALPFDLDDRTHGVRLLATYDLLGHLSLGVIYGYDSGAPLLDYWNPVSRAWDAYRRRQGIDTAPAQNPDQRGPGSERLNLQARWRLRPLLRADLDLYVDAINLRGGAFGDASDSASFAPGARVRAPRWYRLGAEYRY